MNLPKRLVMFCVALAIASCAPVQPRPPELQVPPERITQKGYSLVPLNEKGWLIAGRDSHQLALVKGGKNPDETFAIQSMVLNMPPFKTSEELLRLIKEGQEKDTDPQRFKIIRHEVAYNLYKGTDCATSHMVTEDRAPAKRSSKTGSMILEILSLTCVQPKDKNIGVNVSYSHRYYPNQGDAAFLEKARSVLNSVEFTD